MSTTAVRMRRTLKPLEVEGRSAADAEPRRREGSPTRRVRALESHDRRRPTGGARIPRTRRSRPSTEVPNLEGLQQMSGAVAHLFTHLMTGIGFSADSLRSEIPEGSVNHMHLDVIDQAWKRGSEVCRRLLLASGDMPFTAAEIDLNEVVRQAEPIASTLAIGGCLRILLEDGRLPFAGDVTMIRQLLFELISNAREAIGDGPGQITISTRRRMRTAFDRGWDGRRQQRQPSEPDVVLEVSDDGCGMKPELVAKIFEPFFTTKNLGRGLGLTAAFSIVEKHRGTIRVKTQEGRGTTFQILFPAAAG